MTVTFTTRAGAPKVDGTETMPESAVRIAQAMDIFDAEVGYKQVTSGTRPDSPYPGETIFEEDTRLYRVWNALSSRWDFVAGDSRAEFTGGASPSSGQVWGAALTVDNPSSSIESSRPAGVAGAGTLAEAINIPEVGTYFVEGIVTLSAVVTSRAYLAITGGPTTGFENEYGRASLMNEDRGHIGVKIRTTQPDFRVAVRHFVTVGGLTSTTRLKITRDVG